jgi:hypothetical protein
VEGRNGVGSHKSFDIGDVRIAWGRFTLLTCSAQGLVSFVNLSRYVGRKAGIYDSALGHFDVVDVARGRRRDAHACLNICKGPIFIKRLKLCCTKKKKKPNANALSCRVTFTNKTCYYSARRILGIKSVAELLTRCIVFLFKSVGA